MIKVLIVEDSLVVREALIHILGADPEIEVIGTAGDGEEAIVEVKRKRPDVVTMDINMPKMNGFVATRRIMEEAPTPIVIVSGAWDPKDATTTFRTIEAGALTVVPRPMGIGHPDYERSIRELVQTVKLMAEVKVVRRWPAKSPPAARPLPPAPTPLSRGGSSRIEVVAMGASTGGPLVLQRILSGLGGDFAVPLLITQHMSPGFVEGFARWLDDSTPLRVAVAVQGERLEAGRVYVAPDGAHMGVDGNQRIHLSTGEPDYGLRPSVAHLFRSVLQLYGANSVGVLLTGMGRDGAAELWLMREMGAVTIVQDRESSVVHGMPGEAIELGAAQHVLSPAEIAATLMELVEKSC